MVSSAMQACRMVHHQSVRGQHVKRSMICNEEIMYRTTIIILFVSEPRLNGGRACSPDVILFRNSWHRNLRLYFMIIDVYVYVTTNVMASDLLPHHPYQDPVHMYPPHQQQCGAKFYHTKQRHPVAP